MSPFFSSFWMSWDILLQSPLDCGAIVSQLFILPQIQYLLFYECTKYIEVDCHFVREKLQKGDIVLTHVKTCDQLVDILTKSLAGGRVDLKCNKLGIINIYAPT
ncbi:hypothetical protein Dimus_039184 [Dionaea muscipula]